MIDWVIVIASFLSCLVGYIMRYLFEDNHDLLRKQRDEFMRYIDELEHDLEVTEGMYKEAAKENYDMRQKHGKKQRRSKRDVTGFQKSDA